MNGFSALCFHCPTSSDSTIAACYQMPTELLSFYLLISSSTDELSLPGRCLSVGSLFLLLGGLSLCFNSPPEAPGRPLCHPSLPFHGPAACHCPTGPYRCYEMGASQSKVCGWGCWVWYPLLLSDDGWMPGCSYFPLSSSSPSCWGPWHHLGLETMPLVMGMKRGPGSIPSLHQKDSQWGSWYHFKWMSHSFLRSQVSRLVVMTSPLRGGGREPGPDFQSPCMFITKGTVLAWPPRSIRSKSYWTGSPPAPWPLLPGSSRRASEQGGQWAAAECPSTQEGEPRSTPGD